MGPASPICSSITSLLTKLSGRCVRVMAREGSFNTAGVEALGMYVGAELRHRYCGSIDDTLASACEKAEPALVIYDRIGATHLQDFDIRPFGLARVDICLDVIGTNRAQVGLGLEATVSGKNIHTSRTIFDAFRAACPKHVSFTFCDQPGGSLDALNALGGDNDLAVVRSGSAKEGVVVHEGLSAGHVDFVLADVSHGSCESVALPALRKVFVSNGVSLFETKTLLQPSV